MEVIDEFTFAHEDGTTMYVSVIEDKWGKRYIVEDFTGVHTPIVYSPGKPGPSDALTPDQQRTAQAVEAELGKR